MQPPRAPRSPQDPYAHMEVLGRGIMSIVQGMEVVQARALRMLADNGIASPIKPDGWYPMSGVLASFQQIFEHIGPVTVKGIGRKVPDTAPFPPAIDSLEQALRSIGTAYQATHRGSGHIGTYRYEPGTAPRSARMVSDAPYPCDLDIGILESMGDRFRPADALWVRVEHAPGGCRKNGDRACTYHLSW